MKSAKHSVGEVCLALTGMERPLTRVCQALKPSLEEKIRYRRPSSLLLYAPAKTTWEWGGRHASDVNLPASYSSVGGNAQGRKRKLGQKLQVVELGRSAGEGAGWCTLNLSRAAPSECLGFSFIYH